MKSNLAALVAGSLFGFGLMLSGMSSPGEHAVVAASSCTRE